ncbi:MAG: Uma2 family endonuclease [Bacteroidales bacterium]|nr:Uma2 family endonuclease [Bacteroidales bacterium]
MNTLTPTVATLLHELGDIPAGRIRISPPLGQATIADLSRPLNHRCELIDGTLVEKAVGWEESFLAGWLLSELNRIVLAHNLGVVTGEQGFVELASGNVRGPDVAFFSWERMEGRRRPREAYPRLTPDLVIEVLSPSNTPAEMERKRRDFFDSGTLLVWEIDPHARTVRVFTPVDHFTELVTELGPADSLDGGGVLPGLRIPIADLFAELDRHG